MLLSTKSSRQFQTDLIRKMAVYVTASYYDPYLCLLSGGDLLWPWSLLQQQGRKSEFLLTATENWKYLKIIHSLSQQKYNQTKGDAKNFCYVFFLCGLEGFVLQYHALQFRSSSLFCFPRKLSEHMLLTHRSALGIFEHLRCRMEAVRCDLRSSVLFSM